MQRFGRACLAGLAVFLLVYLLVCVAAVIGTRGWLGFEQSNTAVVVLVFMGMPWSMILAALPADVLELLARLIVAWAPLFNLWLLSRACRRRRRRR